MINLTAGQKEALVLATEFYRAHIVAQDRDIDMVADTTQAEDEMGLLRDMLRESNGVALLDESDLHPAHTDHDPQADAEADREYGEFEVGLIPLGSPAAEGCVDSSTLKESDVDQLSC